MNYYLSPWIYYDMAEDEGGGGDAGGESGGGDAPQDVTDFGGASTSTSTYTGTTTTYGQLPSVSAVAPIGTLSTNKYIRKINVFKDVNGDTSTDIPKDGSYRNIEIIGTPGSTFSLTINKSDGCSLLASPLNNVSIPNSNKSIDKYTFIQRFPSTSLKETYEITITPNADVKLGGGIPTTNPTYSLKQYINPVVTLTNTANTDQTLITTPTAYTIKGKPNINSNEIENLVSSTATTGDEFGDISISWTMPKKQAGYLYVKKQPDINDWNDDVRITKTVPDGCDGDIVRIGPTTTNLEKGMVFEGNTVIKKQVTSIKDTTDCDTNSDSIVLNDVNDLVIGLEVESNVLTQPVFITEIDKIWKNIKLSSKEPIKPNSMLTFNKRFGGKIKEVTNEFFIKTTNKVSLPNGLALTFNKPKATTIKPFLSSTSGSIAPVVSGTISVLNFGEEDVTFTQALDNIFTYTPNAWDQRINAPSGSTTTINLLAPDTDENYRVKTPAVVATASNGAVETSLSAGVGTITYTPTGTFIGNDFITFKVNDGTTDSDTKTIYLKVK